MGVRVEIPTAFHELFIPARYKLYYGGRGAAKSWSIGRVLIVKTSQQKLRVLCTREFQNSIADSVHRVLVDQIDAMGLAWAFDVTQTSIRSKLTGSEFIFKGLRHNISEIKSTEGIDICWIEEAQNTSKESLGFLIPTIRKPGSEIWFTLNLQEEGSPVHTLMQNPPPGAIVRLVNFDSNPFFTEALEFERRASYQLIQDAKDDAEREYAQAEYDHIWLGMPRRQPGSAVIKRWVIDEFETPSDARFFHGADWGFANDPTALVRSYIKEEILFIDYETFGHKVEIDDTPDLFDKIPTARDWPIKGDSSRPETISYMRRKGFNVEAAAKWPGSVEDGIAHLNGFKRIVIHKRCTHLAKEARMYRYRVDRVTGDILPIIVDAHNHGWDSVRYSLDGYIQARGGLGVWGKLAS